MIVGVLLGLPLSIIDLLDIIEQHHVDIDLLKMRIKMALLKARSLVCCLISYYVVCLVTTVMVNCLVSKMDTMMASCLEYYSDSKVVLRKMVPMMADYLDGH